VYIFVTANIKDTNLCLILPRPILHSTSLRSLWLFN